MSDDSVPYALQQFFGGYFHEDWVLEADDWQGIVDGYVDDDRTAEPLRTLAREIDELRGAHTETELAKLMYPKIGANYNPQPLSYKEWLEQISERLRQHAGAIENGTTFLSGRERSSKSDDSVPHDLDQFFVAYFHQDRPLDTDDWLGIVDRYAASSTRSPQQLLALAAHIDEFRESRSSSELHAAFMNINGSYDPRPKLTYQEWLWHIAVRLREHATAVESGRAP